MASSESESDSGPTAAFTTTHWSVVVAAGEAGSDRSRDALEQLCRVYWYPLYAHVRRQGHSPEDAQDLTQDFFARFLEKGYFRNADPARGRFRSFLLAALKHFLVNEWRRGQAARRGGGATALSWDQQDAEDRYRLEPVDGVTPEKIFERRWAVTLLERVLARLREDYAADGNQELFEALKGCVSDGGAEGTGAQTATRLGLTEGAVRSATHRLRERYRNALRLEVGRTVATSAEVDEELRHLAAVLRQ